MSFKRKRRNRRHTRDYVLDVKLSASQRRQNRVRRLTLFFSTSLILFAAFFGVWRGSETLLRHKIYENPYFAIERLDVETDGVLASEQIRSWAGVRPKDNLMALDLARVKRDLELVPAIESVIVERVLPRTLRIGVTEREPIAQVVFQRLKADAVQDGGTYTLDAHGYFMFPVGRAQRAMPAAQTNDYLPIITGIPLSDLRPGRQVESPQVRAALGLIRAFERSPMVGVVDLKLIDVTQANVLVVRTGQGNEITFGLNDFDGQLRRWRLVHDEAQRRGKLIISLELAVSNNSPMLWADAAGALPPPPKPAKPSPYKKKHV
jgi:hypothetical protein